MKSIEENNYDEYDYDIDPEEVNNFKKEIDKNMATGCVGCGLIIMLVICAILLFLTAKKL